MTEELSNARPGADDFGPEARLIEPEELRSWILHEDDDLLVFNKPGWLVCHPSKNGPWSSLVGAAREYTGLERLHLISRLDRETSGLIILGKHRAIASLLQVAFSDRKVEKRYLALVTGNMKEPRRVESRIGDDARSPVLVRQKVTFSRDGKPAETLFTPLVSTDAVTLVEVEPITGRKHQIRVHAEWLGHCIAGDKIYGPDPLHYLEFIEHGWTENLSKCLPIARQALHAEQIVIHTVRGDFSFYAEVPEDMRQCWEQLSGQGWPEVVVRERRVRVTGGRVQI